MAAQLLDHSVVLNHQVQGVALGPVHHHLAHPGAIVQQAAHPLSFIGIAEFAHPQGHPIATQGGLEHSRSALGDDLASLDDRQMVSQSIHFL